MVLLISFFALASGGNAFGSPPLAVDYYVVNIPTEFARSSSPFSLSNGDYSVSESVVSGGVHLQAQTDGGTGEVGIGFYIIFETLGLIDTVDLAVAESTYSGTMSLAMNLWFDKDDSGDFFTWSESGVLIGLGGDDYAVGQCGAAYVCPLLPSGDLRLDDTTTFYDMGVGSVYTLAQLKAGSVSGVDSTTMVAIWVGLDSDGSEESSGQATVLLQSSATTTTETVMNGTGRAPSFLFTNGDYTYRTSYGLFTFTGATPLTYSLTPDPIGSTILYSAIWLNATIPSHQNFPYVGPSSVLAAIDTDFHTRTQVCARETCEPGDVIALLEMSWHFYSGWTTPKLSITLTQTAQWAHGDFHLFWIHSVTEYTKWLVEGQCSAGEIVVATPIAPVLEQVAVAVLENDLDATIVDDPNQPSVCTRLDWNDYGITRPILGGQFTNPILPGKNLVVDFGVNVFDVDPSVAVIVQGGVPSSSPDTSGSGWWWGESTTAHTSLSSETGLINIPQQELLTNWLKGSSPHGLPNMLIVFVPGVVLVAAVLVFVLKKREN